MLYLVDAYNLLFCTLKKKDSLEKTRLKLIEELNDAISQCNLSVVLVFDGAQEGLPHPKRGHFDAVEIVYTSKAKTADMYIIEEVTLSRSPTQITVVTNDRELAGRCHHHQAKILSTENFLNFLFKKKAKKKKRLSSHPLREFRESDPEIARLLAIFEKKFLEEC